MRARVGAVALASTLLLTACGGQGGIQVSDARIGRPTGPNAALYFTATSGGEEDELVGAASSIAGSVELHETTMSGDGTMGMQPVDALELPADGTLVLEPGGPHLMLIAAQRVEVGDTVEVTITWENAGEMTFEAEVVDPGDTFGAEG